MWEEDNISRSDDEINVGVMVVSRNILQKLLGESEGDGERRRGGKGGGSPGQVGVIVTSASSTPASSPGEGQPRHQDQVKPGLQSLLSLLSQRRLLDVPLGPREPLVVLHVPQPHHLHPAAAHLVPRDVALLPSSQNICQDGLGVDLVIHTDRGERCYSAVYKISSGLTWDREPQTLLSCIDSELTVSQ